MMMSFLFRFRLLRLFFVLSFSGLLAAGHAAAQNVPHVILKTSMGEIVLELESDKAPLTVENFLQYVKSGHYNGTIFHRVINGFMIQGGGFDLELNEKKTAAPIKNEAGNGLKNEPYTIAMARRNDPHSAAAQFFINVAYNPSLDYQSIHRWGYAVFGKVIKGHDVVDRIKHVSTGHLKGHANVPTKPVIIESATLKP